MYYEPKFIGVAVCKCLLLLSSWPLLSLPFPSLPSPPFYITGK